MRTALAIALTALAALTPALAAGAPGHGAPAPGDRLVARADAMAAQWGRCPTARTAHRVLAQARRTTAPRPRVRRARAAVRSWQGVARECARPVPMPSVTLP
ncbi:hypothetical protein [Miltoncostaea marina]|uniref:hypothetical protein n=1 Tax=Miltoncostaea marina TaxID=2843215 RepID=UPI001C3CFB02|nr:hypothetical protein [Miltoncostaea marina]